MTTIDFICNLPGIIIQNDKEAFLEIVYDTKNQKGICYRYADNTTSYGTYGKNWEEVLAKLKIKLKK